MQTICDFIRKHCITFPHKISHSNVSATICWLRSIFIPFISTFIEHERYVITKLWPILYIFFLWSQSIFNIKNVFTVTCINSAAVWLFLSRRYVQTSCWRTIVRVKLELYDVIIKDRFTSNIQDINHFRYFVRQSPMIVKIFDAVSFFLLNDRFWSLSFLWQKIYL